VFWDFTLTRMAVPYRSFGTNYHSERNGSWTTGSLKIGPKVCPEASVRKDNSTFHEIPKERRYHVYRSGRLLSLKKRASR